MNEIECDLIVFIKYDLYPYITSFECKKLRHRNGRAEYYWRSGGAWYASPLFVLEKDIGDEVSLYLRELQIEYTTEQNNLKKLMKQKLNNFLSDFVEYQIPS